MRFKKNVSGFPSTLLTTRNMVCYKLPVGLPTYGILSYDGLGLTET